jgi:hypothetical protein
MYKSLFSIVILAFSGVDARIYEKVQAAQAAEEAAAVEKSLPEAVQKLEGMIEQGILKADPEVEFDVPKCNCTCSDDITGTEGVIVTPTGPGLLKICVPETYLKIFLYFPVRLRFLRLEFCANNPINMFASHNTFLGVFLSRSFSRPCFLKSRPLILSAPNRIRRRVAPTS